MTLLLVVPTRRRTREFHLAVLGVAESCAHRKMSHDSMHTVQCAQDTGYYVLRSGRARVTRALLEVTQYVQVFLLKQNFYHRRETAVDLFAQLARHETLERDGTMKAGVARRNKSART